MRKHTKISSILRASETNELEPDYDKINDIANNWLFIEYSSLLNNSKIFSIDTSSQSKIATLLPISKITHQKQDNYDLFR
ncbi:MAG: hypothetical protein IKY67_07555 [Paludibacteraceae bacterium]|nr:hypothetical protein [Paludibacteraceae bacterium]MBR5823983.1 hypothetical protein [Paludibacteraceae bacterium]